MSISQNVGAVRPCVRSCDWTIGYGAPLVHARRGRADVLFMAMPGDPSSPTLFTYIANHGPFIVPALAAIAGSFGNRVNWLVGVTLTLMWAVLAVIFAFGGPNGPGLVFEIAGIVIVGSGLIIAALSFRAFASDF